MFIGEHDRYCDKGRIHIPPRYLLEAQNDFLYTNCHDSSRALEFYPRKTLDEVARMPPVERRLSNELWKLIAPSIFECHADNRGRITLPSSIVLRTFGELSFKAVLIGYVNSFELWRKVDWY